MNVIERQIDAYLAEEERAERYAAWVERSLEHLIVQMARPGAGRPGVELIDYLLDNHQEATLDYLVALAGSRMMIPMVALFMRTFEDDPSREAVEAALEVQPEIADRPLLMAMTATPRQRETWVKPVRDLSNTLKDIVCEHLRESRWVADLYQEEKKERDCA